MPLRPDRPCYTWLADSALVLLVSLSGCMGMTNQSGAPAVLSADAAAVTLASCHVDRFKANVSPKLQASCITCHRSTHEFRVTEGTDDASNAANISALSMFIEREVTSADRTTLLYQVSASSGSSHPFKLGSSDTSFYDFADGILNDPNCQSSGSGSGSDGEFF